MLWDNSHVPTKEMSLRIKDLATAGIPVYLIAKIVKLDDETIKKYYSHEIETGVPETVGRIAAVVARQAEEGNEKSQALYLKTQGARFGWVEKQVVENVNSEQLDELKASITDLEKKYSKEY